MRTTSSTKRRPVKKKFTITNFFQLTSSPGAKKGKRSEDEVCHDLNLYCFEAFVILVKSEIKKNKKIGVTTEKEYSSAHAKSVLHFPDL